ncbi:MAG: translation initiation factor IF-3 [Thermodesulfobacteriota bacterium]|nr:translation initiation factor IF-3 [Thermodesulfobacteriota bacterium]
MALIKEYRINRKISANEVRVIGPDGAQMGIFPIAEALRLAEEAALDLVEVSPGSQPPVCRIMDYGKLKYQQSKKAHEAKKRQSFINVKVVKLRPTTDEHDLQIKVKNIRRFLERGDKTKVTVFFKGREIVYSKSGMEIIGKISKQIEDVGIVEKPPKMEGRTLTMTVAPRKAKGVQHV